MSTKFHRKLAHLAMTFASLTTMTLSAGQSNPGPKLSEIIIVGTVHKETQSFTSSDLLTILKSVRPDVILCELDSSFFTKEFKFEHLFGGLEEIAICEYMKTSPVMIRPYDIEGRNDFYRKNDTFNLEKQFFNKVSDLAGMKKLGTDSQEILNQVRDCFKKRDVYLRATPRRINSFQCDEEVAQKWFAVDLGYAEIIRRTPELRAFKDFQANTRTFELQRNNAMVRNIVKFAQEFQGKRILVVCGFEHRHYLRISLNFHQPSSFIVNEYWDYDENTHSAQNPTPTK